MQKVFLISSSKYQGGGFWEHCFDALKKFLGKPTDNEHDCILFIPYANADGNYDGYTEVVSQPLKRMGYEVVGAHAYSDPRHFFEDPSITAICIGGGNTWVLNHILQKCGYLSRIAEKVKTGEWKYFSASAGSVTACKSILTTNDMAPVLPQSDEALGLIPFQINPHFVPGSLVPGHMGETREERIRQVLLFNPEWQVVGLPEGCWIEGKGDKYILCGEGEACIFRKEGNNSIWLPGEEFDPIGML